MFDTHTLQLEAAAKAEAEVAEKLEAEKLEAAKKLEAEAAKKLEAEKLEAHHTHTSDT